MYDRKNGLTLFWTAQIVGFLAAQYFPFGLYSYQTQRGIVQAQAALLGIWLAVGPIRRTTRTAGWVAAALLFATVVVTLAFHIRIGGLFGADGFGWEFLMLMVRLLLVGVVYWWAFGRRDVAISNVGKPLRDNLLRFRLGHLLLITTIVALYFSVHESLDGGALYQLMLVIWICLVGLSYATVSLLTSLAVLEPSYRRGRIAVQIALTLVAAMVIIGQAYDSFGRWIMVWRTALTLLVEIGWLAGSLLALRRFGWRLAKVPVAATASDQSAPSAESQAAARREYKRLALRALAIAVPVAALWIGWTVYVVNQRTHLRLLLDGRPTAGGTMGFVTEAEGNASASPAAKARIAPIVSQVFEIRNHGGTVYGPTGSGRLPLIRQWFGDEPVAWILVDAGQDIPRIQRAFPEAMIAVLPPPQAGATQPPSTKGVP